MSDQVIGVEGLAAPSELMQSVGERQMAFFSRPQTQSAAVKIVSPGERPTSPRQTPTKKDSTQRQCRNIAIYGSCKFEDKGCIYYHPPAEDVLPRPESPTKGVLPAEAVNAPVFVPKTTPTARPTSPQSVNQTQTSLPTPSSPLSAEYIEHDPYDPYGYPDDGDLPPSHMDSLAAQMHGLDPSLYDTVIDQQHMMLPPEYDSVHPMDAFYPSQPTFVRQPLNYHLYTQPLPSTFSHTYFIPDTIREELQKRSELIRTAPAPGLNLPEELAGYHTLVPLEHVGGERRKFGNWYSSVYRATSSKDGSAYALRRIENYRLAQQTAFTVIEKWARIHHPNIIYVREAFTTRAFNDNSLVVAYDYHPNSTTLFEAHIKPKAPIFANGRLQAQSQYVPERTLWTYIVQIANAIKGVHDQGLAVRTIDVTKVLITGKNRIRISSCGIVDVLTFDARQDMALLQQEDLVMFGRLIFALCCSNIAAIGNMQKAVDTLSKNYTNDVKNVALFLVTKPGPHKSIGHLFDMIGSRLLIEMDEMQNSVDRLESELMSELENSRLVRLLCKMGFINERPEFVHEPRWSETGDRYIIKLFRDYVFHQVDENGNPVVNLSHVLTCLSKLDAGTDERIMLVSRDEQSCLVVSYKEIKACMDSTFSDLARGSSS